MIELRNYKSGLAEAFARLRNNPNVLINGYDKTPNPYSLRDAEAHFAQQLKKLPAERFLIFWNNELAGEIGITLQEDVFRLNAEIGYFIGEPFWGKGIATEAIKQMVAYAFSHFTLVRIVAGVFDYNKASMRALEKNGFILESIRKQAVIKNGKIIDDYIWVKRNEAFMEEDSAAHQAGTKNSVYL